MAKTSWEYIEIESAKSSFRAALSRALAQALVDGIDEAREEGRPLSNLQQTDLATMAIMTYEDVLSKAYGALEGAAAIDHVSAAHRLGSEIRR